jgi:sortase A
MTVLRKLFFHRSLELLLWSAAALCFCVLGWDQMLAMQANRAAQQLVLSPIAATGQTPLADAEESKLSGSKPTGTKPAGDAEVIGRVSIPALGISVPMTAGVESESLLRGVGHVDGTAFPGGLGTVALAGHRDTYLRPLEHIARKMDIEVTDRSGTYHYEVESWEIVAPEEVDVLSIRDKPELVLITCYPFHYIGPAPKRFVVHALLVSLTPDAHQGRDKDSHAHL